MIRINNDIAMLNTEIISTPKSSKPNKKNNGTIRTLITTSTINSVSVFFMATNYRVDKVRHSPKGKRKFFQKTTKN